MFPEIAAISNGTGRTRNICWAIGAALFPPNYVL